MEPSVFVAQMRRRWLERPYALVQCVAPVINVALIVVLSACTLAVRWMAGLPIWYLSPLPVLILADWMLCLLQRGYVGRSDCLENAAGVYPRLPPDQCPLVRHSEQQVRDRLLDPAPRYQIAAGVHFCTRCAYHVPALSHHCPLCRRCVRLRDHHCFFLSACVGVDNLANFMAFCLHSCLGCAVATYSIGWHLHSRYLPLDSMYGAVNFLLPPVAAGSWLLGQLQLSVVGLVLLVYLAFTTSLGTAFMLLYQTILVLSGQIAQDWTEIHSYKISPRALQCFRRVFGRLGLLHFIVPYYRIPYSQHLDLDVPPDDIKIL